ncbi:hypothetical protein DOY81_008833 [Sarcophaga bullata]|nr:hypothetical protein DOY81_008833 [Sarcophaga bullata]
MATKRYQPSLTLIPEEVRRVAIPHHNMAHNCKVLQKCHGCASNRCSGHVKNCGDKRNSIEKWLEMVQTTEIIGVVQAG